MGFGIHLAEERKGGEYFAEYANSRHDAGYLYEVELALEPEPNKILVLTNSTTCEPDHMEWARYEKLRHDYKDQGATKLLAGRGFIAVRGYEETKPGHGDTILCLVPQRLTVTKVRLYNRNSSCWEPIDGLA